MTSSRAAQEALLLSTLKTMRTPRRPRSVLMGWSWMDAGFEWISLLPNEPIPRLLESTWDDPHMAAVHRGVSRGTMTGATTEVTKEVMIAIMIAMRTESTDHTDADLHLLTTAEGTALDPDHGHTRHVTTEQQKELTTDSVLLFGCLFLFMFSPDYYTIRKQSTCIPPPRSHNSLNLL